MPKKQAITKLTDADKGFIPPKRRKTRFDVWTDEDWGLSNEELRRQLTSSLRAVKRKGRARMPYGHKMRDPKSRSAEQVMIDMFGKEAVADFGRAQQAHKTAARRELLVKAAAVLTALAAWVALALHFVRV